MTVYSFWIFDKHCNCIFSREWTQVVGGGSTNSKNDEDTAKLLFGAIYSVRNITKKWAGTTEGDFTISDNRFFNFATHQYRAHYYETASGLKFVILSDTKTQNLQNELHEAYANIYIPYITRNALVKHDAQTKIMNQKFINAVESYFQKLGAVGTVQPAH